MTKKIIFGLLVISVMFSIVFYEDLGDALYYQAANARNSASQDNKPPVIKIVSEIISSSNTSPSFEFSSSKEGAIIYRGKCKSDTAKALTGNNVIQMKNLEVGVYSNCRIRVRDNAGNISKVLRIPAFEVFTTTEPPATSETPNTPDPSISTKYPLHTNITATVFWVGEPQGAGSSEDNALSAWDDKWELHYGGYDDYINRNGYYPAAFTPKENPFYLDLPYNDFTNNGTRRPNAFDVIPWAKEKTWSNTESLMKNQWVKITKNENVCYGQIQDAGPYVYNDYNYVFGTNDERPQSTKANNAGMDVSPALRDCLKFNGLNNADNKVDWQFVEFTEVPDGPWKKIITSSQIFWP